MRLTIVHTFGRNAGVVLTVEKDVIRFGRSSTNDVTFDPEYDRDASAVHAELRRDGGDWVLVDLGSRNGTFVAEQRVARRALSPGDEITFGPRGPRVRIEFAGSQEGGGRFEAAKCDPAFAPAAIPAREQSRFPLGALPGERASRIARPGAPELPAPPAGQRVGQRTLAMLISSAVASARSRVPPRMTTRVLAEYVEQSVGNATAGQRRTTVILAGFLFAALLGLGGLVLWTSHSRDEIDHLREQLARLPPEDPRRREIEGRLGSLHPSNASFGRNLYDQSRRGIFMLAAGGQGFCTAFAVRPQVLATNAHCIAAARKQISVVALENEGRGSISFTVSDLRMHPGYREGDQHVLTPDVGVMTIAGRAATVLSLATPQELAQLGAGDDVYLIGFPGRPMDSNNPAATFLAAHIGRVTSAAGRPGPLGDNWLVQHDAPTTHGTSGSPLFNGRGKVVAINAGGYLEGDDETISGRKTEVVKASPYKFAMRIDLLNALLR